MSLKRKLIILLLIFSVITLTSPCWLVWGFIAYTHEQTRIALISSLELPTDISHEDAIDYFDCEYIRVSLSEEEFIERLVSVGATIPSTELALKLREIRIHYPNINLTRYYEIHGGYISGIYRPEYGGLRTRVDCPN